GASKTCSSPWGSVLYATPRILPFSWSRRVTQWPVRRSHRPVASALGRTVLPLLARLFTAQPKNWLYPQNEQPGRPSYVPELMARVPIYGCIPARRKAFTRKSLEARARRGGMGYSYPSRTGSCTGDCRACPEMHQSLSACSKYG